MNNYFRSLASRNRTEQLDRHLALFLTFVAGAANAGGFMAIGQYTSHMSGIISSMADNLSLNAYSLVVAGFFALLAFVSGAAVSAVLVNWGRRLDIQSEYAFPLLLEALLLIVFGLFGSRLQAASLVVVPITIVLLCFIMGLQNAIITKISQSRIRTTHMTGIVTDIGIELGRMAYFNKDASLPPVRADRHQLALLVSLCTSFFLGGVCGAFGFRYVGYLFSTAIGIGIAIIAFLPVMDDCRAIFSGRSKAKIR